MAFQEKNLKILKINKIKINKNREIEILPRQELYTVGKVLANFNKLIIHFRENLTITLSQTI